MRINVEYNLTEEKRLDVFLAEYFKENNYGVFSRSKIQSLINENNILLNNKSVKKNTVIFGKGSIEVNLPKQKELEVTPNDIPLNICYEDDDVIVINKDKGVVVHPAAGNYENTLVNALMFHRKDSLSGINGVIRPGIVHRIDKDTSGLLIVAKNDKSHLALSEQLKDHSLRRIYHAIVCGNLKEDEFTVDAPIGRHPVDRKKMAVTDKNSKPAITHVKVLKRFSKYTYVECRLETGRTHQIRVHMAYINHPILGDNVYKPQKNDFKTDGQCLHAKTLEFIHPTSKNKVIVDSDLPEYFKNVLDKLENKYL